MQCVTAFCEMVAAFVVAGSRPLWKGAVASNMKSIFWRWRGVAAGTLVVSTMMLCGQSTEVIFFGFTNAWKYNATTSYDAVNWTAPAYDDSSLPEGRGVLANESANTL